MDDLPKIDPQGPALVYMVVADHIAQQISDGRLQPGARLFGEAEMAQVYGIAKLTARRAVRELRERGLVITVPSKGTFVTPAAPPAG